MGHGGSIKYLNKNEYNVMVNLFSFYKTTPVAKGGKGRRTFSLSDLNKFILPKTENISFLVLYFKQ